MVIFRLLERIVQSIADIRLSFVIQLPTFLLSLFLNVLNYQAMKGESLFALLAGAAAGLTLGLLFAPEKGEDTRRKVREAAEDGLDWAKDTYAGVKEDAKESMKDLKIRSRLAKRELKELKSTLKDQAADLKEDARDKIIEQLERLEAALRRDEDIIKERNVGEA